MLSVLRDSATAFDLYAWLAYRHPRINPKRPSALSCQQLAMHFGNDRTNIREFRQTVRDVWERQVSGSIRKHGPISTARSFGFTPRRLQRRLVPGAHITLVTDDKVRRRLHSQRPRRRRRWNPGCLSNSMPRWQRTSVWLSDMQLELTNDGWVVTTTTHFKAHWIRTRFDQALDRATTAAGLSARPEVRVRTA
jgi:hypothetical protein